MSGRKQHYIPQALLRAFETPSRGKTKKVWVFRKGQIPYISSIIDAGAERHFYSELADDGHPTLDDRITQYENELVRLLALVREAPINGVVDAGVAAELITHLTIRGAHLRDVFATGVRELTAGIADVFTNEDLMRASLGIDTNTPTPLFREEIKRMLSEPANPLAQCGLPESLALQMGFTWLKENFNQLYSAQRPELTKIFDGVIGGAHSIARNAHVRVLTETLTPEPRMAALSRLTWIIQSPVEGGFVLPDCVAIAVHCNSGASEPCVMIGGDPMYSILCPISPDRLLVGHPPDGASVDVRGFNKAAAVCSHTFFISAVRTHELEELATHIGEQSNRIVSDAATSAINEFVAKSSVVEDISQSTLHPRLGIAPSEMTLAVDLRRRRQTTETERSSYTVTFDDCADRETAEKIASAVNAVVSQMSPYVPIEYLDCITFAGDYVAALRRIDRGFPSSVSIMPTEEEWGTGVAMAPLVIRDGSPKVSIIMRAWLGLGLIDGDSALRTSAAHTLANQLAHVIRIGLLDKALPEMLLSRVEDDWERWLYLHMDGAWTAYFASRVSATFDPEVGVGYRDMLLAVIQKAKESIHRERLAYGNHRDLQKFLEPTVSAVGLIMTYAGMLHGHCDGICQRACDGGETLVQTLEEMSLRAWFSTLGQELAKLFERSGKWESPLEFLSLNRHIERVLWQFGVFPWRDDQGEVRITVV